MTKSINDDFSPSLTQILKNPKCMHESFTYPDSDKTLTMPPKLKAKKKPVADECSLTPKLCKTPLLQNSSGSANRTKSLGMRRRLSSVENSPYGTSPSLRNRTPKRPLVHKYTPSKRIRNDDILLPCQIENLSSTLSNSVSSPKAPSSAPCSSSVLLVLPTSTVGDSKSSSTQQNNPGAKCQSFVGFKTAGNKNIKISDTALNNAKELFSNLLQEENEDQKTFLKKDSDSSCLNTCESNQGKCSPQKLSPYSILKNDKQCSLDSLCVLDTQLALDSYKEDMTDFDSTRRERQSLCGSPVLSVRRRRRKTKKKPKNVDVLKLKDDKTDKIDHDDAESNFDDGCDLALLAVDLSARFEEEEEQGQDQKNSCDKLETFKTNDTCTTSTNLDRNPLLQNSDRKFGSLSTKQGESLNKDTLLPLAQAVGNTVTTNVYTNAFNNGKSTIKNSYYKEDIDNADMSVDDDTLLRVGAQLEWEQREVCVHTTSVQTNCKVSDLNMQCSKGNESCNMPLVGFYTASKKPITISEDALNKARSLLDDEEQNDMDNETNCYVNNGFCTASKKSIPVSETALSRARSLLCEGEITDDTGCNKSNTTVGFKTASNKPLLISDTALEKANQLLEESKVQYPTGKLIAQKGTNVFSNCKEDLKPLSLYGSSKHRKLTNLFQCGKVPGARKTCNEFKLPCRNNDVTSSFRGVYRSQPQEDNCNGWSISRPNNKNSAQASSRKLLGVKCCADSQIAVSDESLLKAAEMLEELFS